MLQRILCPPLKYSDAINSTSKPVTITIFSKTKPPDCVQHASMANAVVGVIDAPVIYDYA